MSQASFAFAAGVDPATIFRACRGDKLRPSTERKLRAALAAIKTMKEISA